MENLTLNRIVIDNASTRVPTGCVLDVEKTATPQSISLSLHVLCDQVVEVPRFFTCLQSFPLCVQFQNLPCIRNTVMTCTQSKEM